MKVNCYTNVPLPLHPHISGHCRVRGPSPSISDLLALGQATLWSLGKMGWWYMKNSLPYCSLVGRCTTLHCITTEIILEFIQGLL